MSLYDDRQRFASTAIKQGDLTNRPELLCIDFGPLGNVITAAATDETPAIFRAGERLVRGRAWMGAAPSRNSGITVDARFNDFAVWSPKSGRHRALVWYGVRGRAWHPGRYLAALRAGAGRW
jgi:hypothetical protein